jgi:hypothetical protein
MFSHALKALQKHARQSPHLVSCIEVDAGYCQELSDNINMTTFASSMQRCITNLQASEDQMCLPILLAYCSDNSFLKHS